MHLADKIENDAEKTKIPISRYAYRQPLRRVNSLAVPLKLRSRATHRILSNPAPLTLCLRTALSLASNDRLGSHRTTSNVYRLAPPAAL